MPQYEYRCSNCNKEICVIQKYDDKPLKKCPECKKHKLEKLMSAPVGISVAGNPRSVGKLMEENTKKMGKEQIQRLSEAEKQQKRPIPKKPDPWWGKAPKEIARKVNSKDKGDQERVKRYIRTGK